LKHVLRYFTLAPRELLELGGFFRFRGIDLVVIGESTSPGKEPSCWVVADDGKDPLGGRLELIRTSGMVVDII
jgi:hypothetical protein